MTRDTGPGPAPLLSAGDGVCVKAGERLSRVTLAVNTEHDAVPHCSAAQSAHQPHTGLILAEGRWGVETIEGSFT